MKVLFLVPYPLHKAPSQRFRVEAYFEILEKEGIGYDIQPFLDDQSWLVLYKGGSGFRKVFAVFRGYMRRLEMFTRIKQYDFVFVHREASPLGPPFFEWLVSRVLRMRIIYDFDDAIWIPNISETNKIALSLKAFWKIEYISKWSYKVSAGNQYLLNWAKQYNQCMVYNPTCVDMDHKYNLIKDQETDRVTIGWTGSHSTLKYLDIIKPLLEDLEKDFLFEFIVICDKAPEWKIKSLKFIPWKEATEIRDLLEINIGIMPLVEDVWSEGKCGFKLIQYLALGIPAVASPVGVNKNIIDEGVNGYLCASSEEWKKALVQLLNNTHLRRDMGRKGKEKMKKEFSIRSNSSNFISLFS